MSITLSIEQYSLLENRKFTNSLDQVMQCPLNDIFCCVSESHGYEHENIIE